MNINDLLGSSFDLTNPEELLKKVAEVKKQMDININQALLKIEELNDEKVKEFLKNSVSLAKKES